MGFDANGNFNRIASGGAGAAGSGSTLWQGDAAAGTKILASRHDSHDQDLANGLSECITRTGKGVPVADIPWGGKKIVNLANPSQPQDAATKYYVDNPDAATKSRSISGADLDGRLNFTAPSGVNGITWTYADVSWVARHSEPSKTSNRLVMNNSVVPNTTGDAVGDVFVIDDTGRVNNSGYLTNNLSWDGAAWRAIALGYGTQIRYAGGTVTFASNDIATTVDTYKAATLRDYFRATNSDGNSFLDIVKSASAKVSGISGYLGATRRWLMYLGNQTAESGTDRVGSDFVLYSYNNAGTTLFQELLIDRGTHLATFGGAVTAVGTVTSGSNFDSTATTCIVSASSGGSIRLRPDGPTVTTSSTMFTTTGDISVCEAVAACSGGVLAGRGIRSKAGYQGAYQANWMNLQYASPNVAVWVDGTSMGNITWASDYRIKRNVEPLPSMWDKVKALNPVKYNHRKFRDLFEDDDTEQWGLVAHELQDTLTMAAATGRKDEENVIQSPNPWVVIAALTRALQEAMLRIEALEAGS